jgi:hypothetical protein
MSPSPTKPVDVSLVPQRGRHNSVLPHFPEHMFSLGGAFSLSCAGSAFTLSDHRLKTNPHAAARPLLAVIFTGMDPALG